MIAHVAKILQLALITGTDIVDHMRMIVLKASDEELYLDEEYVKNSNSNIEKMLQEAASNMFNQEGG